jgi:hypothetical protein
MRDVSGAAAWRPSPAAFGLTSRRLTACALALALVGSTTAAEAQRRRGRAPRREAPPAEETPPTPPTPPAEEGGARQLTDADRAQARALFQAGAAAVDAGRWADAVASFRSAYELTGAASALFNTGFALRALGRYREARDAFVELGTLGNVSDAMRTQSEELLAEVRMRIARVRLGGLEEETRYGVRLDGAGVEDAGLRPLVLEADPGTHAVDVTLAGFEPFTWSGTLGDGALLDVPVNLVAVPVGGGGGGGGGVVEEAWFWLLIGGVVAVGAGLVTYFVLDDQAQLRGESPMVIRL